MVKNLGPLVKDLCTAIIVLFLHWMFQFSVSDSIILVISSGLMSVEGNVLILLYLPMKKLFTSSFWQSWIIFVKVLTKLMWIALLVIQLP